MCLLLGSGAAVVQPVSSRASVWGSLEATKKCLGKSPAADDAFVPEAID